MAEPFADLRTPLFVIAVAAALVAGAILFLLMRAAGTAAAMRADLREMRRGAEESQRLVREETERRARALREELGAALVATADSLRAGIDQNRVALDGRLETNAGAQARSAEALRGEVSEAVRAFGDSLKLDVAGLSRSVNDRIGLLSEGLGERQATLERSVGEKLQLSSVKIEALAKANADAHADLRRAVEERLEKLRVDNEAKLEQIRLTVDEKLQSTLEKRLGESFRHVSERLEHVHRGLGEMQVLATGVGDLKKVLSNVKDRGGWAEMQLGALLEQMLTREQYLVNARIDPASSETVEFAIRLPGSSDDREVLLPIDAKFPKEDYERLVAAWEHGDGDAARAALDALETVIDHEARKIASKYVKPPHSTDFAIMFLPTEGLFAEAMRRPGLAARLQQKYKVAVAGPTTLGALLTSLQMGFRTLAIQKRSSEVWQVLADAKREFEKYGDVWDKLAKQLQTAQNTVEEAGKRTRAVARKLKDVEGGEAIEGDQIIALPLPERGADLG